MKYKPTSATPKAKMNADKYDYNCEPESVPYPDYSETPEWRQWYSKTPETPEWSMPYPDYSETPEWRQMETDTVGDIRTVAIAALDRGEYDIAIALIQLIRDFK